jgi:hypothetical protein
MVNVTKGKNVTVETYDAESKEFTGDGTTTAFVMTNAVAESDVKYSRAYVDNEEVTISSINTGTKTVTLAAAPANGAVVIIHTPSTKNGAFSVQQDVKADITTKTEDIKELGNDAVTRDVVERVGTLALTFAQANNHTVTGKLALNSKNDTEMVVAVKYKNTSPVSYRIYKEAKVGDLGSGVAAGGIATETVTLNWKPPLDIKTT